MKKFFLSVIVVGTFAIYSLSQRGSSTATQNLILPSVSPTQPSQTVSDQTGSGTPPTIVPTSTPVPARGPTPAPAPTPTPKPAPTPAPAPVPKGQYVDGSYVGVSADAYYGYIQVKAVISGGKLTDVIFLSYPNDRSTSREINSQAMPYLKQEAIAAQSANVNIVSGATDSSLAFRQSLLSALSQAKS